MQNVDRQNMTLLQEAASSAASCVVSACKQVASLKQAITLDSCAIMTQHLAQGCSASNFAQQHYYRYL